MFAFGQYYLTRLILQKALACVYLIAFLVVLHQFKPLLGENGLLPVYQFIKLVPFNSSPSIFYLIPYDWAFTLFGLLGLTISLIALTGISEKHGLFISMLVWFLLWLIYLSFVNVGQTFYAFGWESMLLETGFLAIFLGDRQSKVPIVMIFFFRWVLFRDMFGAGLIKLRADSCWKDLTCMYYHYETQPIPNPLSWFVHLTPQWFHKLEVLYNHLMELFIPFLYFTPQPLSTLAGILTLFFQSLLMLSGNFSFLNLLTIVLTISTFSDSILMKVMPYTMPNVKTFSTFRVMSLTLVVTIVCILSIKPLLNLLSTRQIMNTSFDPLHLVNTYGAFGAITKQRNEILIEGTDNKVITEATIWQEYEFLGKPGKMDRGPAQIAPYHLRLDWLMWFAAFHSTAQDPWFFHLMKKLLEGDKAVLSLFKTNPFPNHPPLFIRAQLYKYNFTTWEERSKTGNWWKRELVGNYFPTVSLDKRD